MKQKGSYMINNYRFIIVFVLLAIAGLFINLHADITVPINKPFVMFPTLNRTWLMTSQAEFSENVLNVLKPTDYLSRQYQGDNGARVGLYIGYHGGGKGSGGIHSPKNCLPGSGWYEVSSKRLHLEVNGDRINLVRAVYQKGDYNELFLYWFQVKGKTLSDEYSLKLAEITNSVLYRRRDSAFIRVSVPFESDEQRANAVAERFVRDFVPVIREFLPS
jgi:EpsI family protein